MYENMHSGKKLDTRNDEGLMFVSVKAFEKYWVHTSHFVKDGYETIHYAWLVSVITIPNLQFIVHCRGKLIGPCRPCNNQAEDNLVSMIHQSGFQALFEIEATRYNVC